MRALVEAGAEIQRVAELDSALEAAYLAIVDEGRRVPSVERVRVMRARVHRGDTRSWTTSRRSRLILTTLIVPTVLYVAAVDGGALGGTLPGVAGMSRGELRSLERRCRAIGRLATLEAFQVLVVDQILVLYMLAPLFIPLTIASYSIIGEKQLRRWSRC